MAIDVKKEFPQTAEILYKSYDGKYLPALDNIPSYEEIVMKLAEIEVMYDDGYYQGTSIFVVSDGKKYGYVEIDWGSCSGCDALKSCCNFDDLQKLVDTIENSIIWKDSFDEFKKWFYNRDWEGLHIWHTGADEFISMCNEKLLSPQEKLVKDIIE